MNHNEPALDPKQFVTHWKMRDGTHVTIRPICPEDEPLMVRFHETLSDASVHFRYFGQMDLNTRIRHERLARICSIDFETEIALVAEHVKGNGRHEILGVGRLSRAPGSDEAEFAILISDLWQGRGLGAKLLKKLVQIGRREKLRRIVAHILPDNIEMQNVSKLIGFKMKWTQEEWLAELDL